MMSIIFSSVQPSLSGSESLCLLIRFFPSLKNLLEHSTDSWLSPSANLSGNRSHPTKNSAGVDDKMHVMIYRADRIREELGLTRDGCILVGLMSGGDYNPVRSILYFPALHFSQTLNLYYRQGSLAAVPKRPMVSRVQVSATDSSEDSSMNHQMSSMHSSTNGVPTSAMNSPPTRKDF
jgi:hypothetical protein